MKPKRQPFKLPAAGEAAKSLAEPLVALIGRDDGLDAGQVSQGWRCVGVDEHGRKLYAPPSRYSVWFTVP